jgi:hypothetical protein
VDYRKLNGITKKEYPGLMTHWTCLLEPDDSPWIWGVIIGRWCSILTMRKIQPSRLVKDLWQSMVIPSDLCTTPVMYEQLMETILRGLTSCALYTWTAWSWLAACSENICTVYKKYSSDSKRPTWNST